MRHDTIHLTAESPGTERSLAVWRFGRPGARPKAYLQAALHADEMPGVLILQHLMPLLERAEAGGTLVGEVVVVPVANPIGLSQWTWHRPQGRFDNSTLQNFNRGYPDLAALTGDRLGEIFEPDGAANLPVIRAAFARALADLPAATALQSLRIELMKLSFDADHVLDLHCDHEAPVHLYASPAWPEFTTLLCRAVGARVALIAEVSGGNAFDEAHTAPWAELRRRFGSKVPLGGFSTTLEYRGQQDVSDALAAEDAEGLLAYLTAVGVLSRGPALRHPDAEHLPLAGALEVMAPAGGVIAWEKEPGALVRRGDALGWIIEPQTRRRVPIEAPLDGIMFRRELWRMCMKGQGLAHVAGKEPVRSGHLMSD
jgi:hypothetical protein